jgi:squalene-associated FAD-dependent desaturase
VAVVGGGWAGLSAAVRAASDGHHVTVFEASRQWGGRARSLPLVLPDGQTVFADNGQHILIGAYTDTLRLMKLVGVDVESALLRMPLALVHPDGTGLQLPHWPRALRALAALPTLEVLTGVLQARGWTWHDRFALLATATRWQLQGFKCAPGANVAQLCQGLTPRLLSEFIEPLCVSALNTPAPRASGQVFLRVLQDAMFGVAGGSNLLLPRIPLGALLPQAAMQWLQQPVRHADLRLGQRVTRLEPIGVRHAPTGWRVNEEPFDHVVWANLMKNMPLAHDSKVFTATKYNTPTLPAGTPVDAVEALHDWQQTGHALAHETIATVYAWCPLPEAAKHALPRPMTALRSTATWPAQFVFDRSWLGNPPGLVAFVTSACSSDAKTIEHSVLAQAQAQLGMTLQPIKTVVEKRATFACTPGLLRPPQTIAPRLSAAGDHIEGPYPATLEGAVRSGWSAGALL